VTHPIQFKTLAPGPQQAGADLQPVRFEFTDPDATSVCVAGTFNNWHPETRPMRRYRNGCWVRETSLPSGTYEYCLVVDGRFRPDPLALTSVPNPFGGNNSVLTVYPTLEEAHLVAAAHSPMRKTTDEI
jgi:1,4-alpha-glucan branching enzyme